MCLEDFLDRTPQTLNCKKVHSHAFCVDPCPLSILKNMEIACDPKCVVRFLDSSPRPKCVRMDSHGVCTLVSSFHMESMNFILWFDFGGQSNISGSVRQGVLNCIISFNKIFELGLSL
jgi:hypothetical protein